MQTQTLRQFEPSYAAAQPQDQAFLALVDFISRSRQIELRQHADKPLGLLINALLEYSRQSRFVKYDPWDATIQVKTLGASPVVYQYNPFRDVKNRRAEGQKPAAPAGKPCDFLDWETFPDNEHYLVWTAASGRRFGILVQPAPIVPGHLIIASLDRPPESQQHSPQVMSPAYACDMHELQALLGESGYAMGFNGRYAGASIDHFHTQAVPKLFLPFIRAWEREQLAVAKSYQPSAHVRVKILDPEAASQRPWLLQLFGLKLRRQSYPADGIVFESDQPAAVLPEKIKLLQLLLEENITFNSIAWQSAPGRTIEVFFPRGQEAILNGVLKAGYVEMSGMLVLPNKDAFDGVSRPEQGEEGLRQAGLPSKRYHSLLKKFAPGTRPQPCPIPATLPKE